MFNIRAVSLDHYVSRPIEELYDKEERNLVKEWQEPVLRIFGATDDGFKSCVHIHGVYPYIYVPYKGGDNAERDALLLGAALDEALRTSLNQRTFRFVHKVSLVSGIPLYGYHSKHRQFFKIYFYNPFHIRKAFDLLLSGVILGQKFQPHEAHIPYALQFMMDYNVYGMSFVSFSKVKYRRNPANPDCLVGVREEDILSEKVKKMTWSQLEVDAWAGDILNRVGQGVVGVNPGLQAIWEDEQNRRRAQNRHSQITLQQSQSRPEAKTHPTEVQYKALLARKLTEIPLEESESAAASEEPAHSYPAEVPENARLLQASAIDEGVRRPRVRESVADVSSLIDEKILTQMSGNEKERAESESEDEMEFDSVLGRNQKPEEEAEPEDEEGADMTQPLDSDEEVICGAEGNRREPGRGVTDREDTFWRSMADRIFQLDGAQESSSESEVEAAPSKSASLQSVSDGSPEFSSPWTTNIMSILSECSDCPAPTAACPTPRTFWFDYSTDLLSENQDAWTQNKSGAHFSDLPGKNESECLDSGCFPAGSKEVVTAEPYADLFASGGGGGGEYFPTPLVCDAAPAVSPAPAVLTAAGDADGPDINLDSICGGFNSPPKENRMLPSLDGRFAESKIIINGKCENEKQKVLQVLSSFAGRKVPSENGSGHLTLKQYIKDCKEIVSVDFKNLCNREMIIIEYKSHNKRSLRNKYLIKPLDKFLERWNSAERKAGDRREGRGVNLADGEKNLRSNYVINVLEKTFRDASTVQAVSNKLTVKSMEILPDGGSGEGGRYDVNENSVSREAVKMKLINSRRGNEAKNWVGGSLKRRSLDLGSAENEKAVKKLKCSSRQNVAEQQKMKKRRRWQNFPEPDAKLINEINSSFEEYFKNIVKRRSIYGKRRKSVFEKTSNEEEEEEEEDEEEEEEEEEEREEASEDEKRGPSPSEKRAAQELCSSSNADPIKFVTRFLSTFSQMADVPPLSITIRLGSSRDCVPVKVNLRPPGAASEKEAKCRGRRRGRKTKIESVDGAADDSSSEESVGGSDPGRRPCARNKPRRDGHYKPLNVIAGGRRKTAACGSRGAEEQPAADGRKSRKSRSQDRFGVCREKQKSRSSGGRKEEKISGGSSVKSLTNPQNLSESSCGVGAGSPEIHSEPELDFIADSDEERKRGGAEPGHGSVKRPNKKNWRPSAKRIPQADADVVASPYVEEKRFVREGTVGSDLLHLPLQEERKTEGGAEPSPSPRAPCALDGLPASPPLGAEGTLEANTQESEPSSFDPVGAESSATILPSRISFSPLSLSGSPLCGSRMNSLESESSGASVAKSQELPCTRTRLNSASLEGSDLSSGRRSLESSNSGGAIGGRVPSPRRGKDACETVTPKRKPLSRKDVVESVQRCSAFESDDKVAFYGNPLDVKKAVDAGFKALKIENRSVAGLKAFRSSLGVSGTEERRNAHASRGQKASRWRLAGNEDCTITPLMKPPPREIASKISFAEINAENTKKASERARRRIIQPLSPGHEEESDGEMELSVTMSCFSAEAGTAEGSGVPEASSQAAAGDVTEPEPSPKKGPLSNLREIERVLTPRNSGGGTEGDRPKDAASFPVASDGSESPKEHKTSSKGDNSFQIRGVTPDGTFGFSHSAKNMEKAKPSDAHQYMSLLAMEVHVQTRKDLRPDPEHDPIRALFYAISFDDITGGRAAGIILVDEECSSGDAAPEVSVHRVPTEKALLEKFLALIREWDPEILAGYEIEMHSWGYLVQRGFVLEMNLLLLLGRVQPEDFTRKHPSDRTLAEDDVDEVPRSVRHMRISGRIVLDIWRVLRHEVALTSYTFENVMYHLAHERHPLLSPERLSFYWEHRSRRFRHLVVEHFVTRVQGLIGILDRLDFIGRTSELSRLFGIQFYEVLSRGSQFRVESMMLRLAKPLNYVPASPSVSQRASMRAPASLPLILEPESLFYADPVIVLDFQSLYPSIIIAYNYCFSTCLGRIEKLGGREPFEFGCTRLQVSPEELKKLENDVNISPAGIAFVNSNVRKGILPAMLEKILETRLMVKKSMKENKGDKTLQKVLFARQLGLKLIANVTYGYTAANFSGRMPCIEVGDSVVSKGRETLHRAIQLVKSNREWRARVVYGDTDSIFVLTPGRTREEAFRIGAEIAEAVTRDNPKPVKLKLEKVYQPSILQTKKRYVGYMFESPDQKQPVFEAKGIETVRRDGCPAVRKILEKALRILFDTRDVSLVKKYTLRQFSKLYQGRVNVQDLIFAKEYRGRKGYRPGACVPALQLAKEWTQRDRRAEPRVKERVPYVVVSGPPGVPLIRLVRSPADLISDPSLRINAAYYITKAIIPPMQRCFSLLGADVASWYAEMPRKHREMRKWSCPEGQKRSTISQYFASSECVVCSEVTVTPLCQQCEKEPQAVSVILRERIRRRERCHDGLKQICRSCLGRPAEPDCASLDCPVLFRRKQAERDEEQGRAMHEILTRYLSSMR